VGGGNNTNPLKYAWARRFDRNTADKVLGSTFAGTELVRNLAFKTRFSFNLGQSVFKGFTPTTRKTPSPRTSTELNQDETRGTEWTWSNTFNYTWVTPTHNLSLLLGQEAISNNFRRLTGSIAGSSMKILRAAISTMRSAPPRPRTSPARAALTG